MTIFGFGKIETARLVFRETFTGDGSTTTFTLSGPDNATFDIGAWASTQILDALPAHITKSNKKPIYDSVIPITRHQITVSSIATATGIVTLDYAPRNSAAFYIWYWYSVPGTVKVIDYYREDFIANMEVSVETDTRLYDTDSSHYLNLKWNEGDTANRLLNILVGGADRSLTLDEDITASTIVNQADVDDTPVDGATIDPISSNWAYDHKAQMIDGPLSPQVLSGAGISASATAGKAKVAAGTFLLRTDTADTDPLFYGTVAETDNLTLANPDTSYFVQCDYNSGNPQYIISATGANGKSIINIGRVLREVDNTFHFYNAGYRLNDGIAKLHHRAGHLRSWEMCTGIAIGDNGDKTFTIAGGHFFRGITSFDFLDWDSGGTDKFTYVKDVDGTWTYVADQTEIDVDNYNDGSAGTGLANCNKYKCDWVFVHPDDGHVYVVYGQENDTLGKIEEDPIPSGIPDLVDVFGALIGRIIIDGGVTAFQRIEMVNVTTFIPSPVINHNDLSSLQGGIADQYYHLASAEYTELNEWLDDVTLGSNGAITTQQVATVAQLVLTPRAEAISAVEGAIFYDSDDNNVYVCTKGA